MPEQEKPPVEEVQPVEEHELFELEAVGAADIEFMSPEEAAADPTIDNAEDDTESLSR